MARTARNVDIPSLGALDRAAGDLSRQLAQALRDAVRRGTVHPGDALPSTRLLAASLQVARGTVVDAYAQLIAEGFLESRGGAGTRVANALALAEPPPVNAPNRLRGGAAGAYRPARAGRHLRANRRRFRPLPAMPFAISVPIGLTAPDDIWRRLGNRLRARGAGAPSGYADPQGALPLREAIADYVRRSRSVRCHADQVVITSGTQQGCISRARCCSARAIRRGSRIRPIAASPRCSTAPDGATRWCGCRSTPTVSTSTPASVSRRMRGSRSSRRRTSIRSACRSAWRGAMRCSPGHVGNARGWSRTITTASCATKAIRSRRCKADPDRVIYLGTFSKILFPSLRLGYVIAPDDLVPAFCGARVLMDRHVPTADQHVLAAFIAEGHLDRHIRRVRGVYAEQRTLLIDTLGARLPRERAWVQPGDQGMHVVLWLAEGIDDLDVVERAAQAGVAVRAVSPMFAPGTARPGPCWASAGSAARRWKRPRSLAEVVAMAADGAVPR